MPDQNAIDLRWIISVIRRWWWIIAGCILLSTVTAYYVFSWIPPVYEASAILLVEPSVVTGANEYNSIIAGERLAMSYSQMLKGQSILETVISDLAMDETIDSLQKKIKVAPIQGTQLIRLTVEADTPQKAVQLANNIPEQFIERMRVMEAERYTTSLESAQEEMDILSARIDETQAKINELSAQSIFLDKDVERLQGLLNDYRNDYRVLQQSYRSVQLSVIQLTNKVKVIETAQSPPTPVFASPTATTLLLIDQSLISGEDAYSGNSNSEILILTYGPLFKRRAVLQEAITELELDEDPDELSRRVAVKSIYGTQLIELTVEAPDVSQAIQVADAIAVAFVRQIRVQLTEPYTAQLNEMQSHLDELSAQIGQAEDEFETKTSQQIRNKTDLARYEDLQVENRNEFHVLETELKQLQLAATQAANSIYITEPAYQPEEPVNNQILFIALAGLVGMLVGSGSVFLFEHLDDKVRDQRIIGTVLGLDTLGSIGRLASKERKSINGSQPIRMDFRMLATGVRLACLKNQHSRTLQVTSPVSLEGKSLVASNLAVALARSGLRVILVDADVRYPQLHQLFGLEIGEGLVGSLLQERVDDKLQATQIEGLMILPAGKESPSGDDPLTSSNLSWLLDELSKQADLVLIDCPPILATADALLFASQTDGILLVLRAGRTEIQTAKNAIERLEQAGGQLIGVVFNDIEDSKNKYSMNKYQKSEDGRWAGSPLEWRKPIAAIAEFINKKKKTLARKKHA